MVVVCRNGKDGRLWAAQKQCVHERVALALSLFRGKNEGLELSNYHYS